MTLREQDRLNMLKAFSRLTPEERHAAAETHLDHVLQRIAEKDGISPGEVYARLVANRNKLCGYVC